MFQGRQQEGETCIAPSRSHELIMSNFGGRRTQKKGLQLEHTQTSRYNGLGSRCDYS